MRYSATLISLLLLCSVPQLARAEVQRIVTGGRVHLEDLIPNTPPEARNLDLGPAPPAGSSRLFTREELQNIALRAGVEVAVTDSVRVARASVRWSQSELAKLIEGKLVSILPAHAKLLRVDAPTSLVTTSGAQPTRITLGQLPHREGLVNTTCVLELSADGQLEQRLVVRVALELKAPPPLQQLPTGTTLTLVVRLGNAQVSTPAVTLEPTVVGSTALLRVVRTRKSLRAKVTGATTAEVLGP